jgi:HEPN domain-containing protein
MPLDPGELGTPVGWLKRARSNLVRAKQPKPEEVLWEDLCFDTQQAVEKSLKAVLLARRIPFRFVHDIAELLTLLENEGVFLPEEIRAAAELTDYAVESRYPGPFEPATQEEFERALAIANTVLAWAEKLINESC